jgi:hypothetical protein
MALFPKDETIGGAATGDAAKRMAWTRELGTRKLLLLFAALLLLWYGYGKIREQQLLAKHWETLAPDPAGLTVVGTLDGRENLGRNMFQIIESNMTSRPELTDFGWNSIFNNEDGEMFSDRIGLSIRSAIAQDNKTGYRMLEPYLRVGVKRLLGDPHPTAGITKEMPILVGEGAGAKPVAFGELLQKFSEGPEHKESEESDAGGSGGAREVEHGLAIPAENLIQVCPVVLTGKQFTDAWVEDKEEPLMGRTTYTVHMGLTDEGRSRFYQWSRNHLNEHVVFVLKGQVVTAGRMTMVLYNNTWDIGPLRDKKAAYDLADYLNGKNR